MLSESRARRHVVPPQVGWGCTSAFFVWLLDLFLFPKPVVEDLPGITNASVAMLYVATCRSRQGGMCPLL
jgi:hypothetical protein